MRFANYLYEYSYSLFFHPDRETGLSATVP